MKKLLLIIVLFGSVMNTYAQSGCDCCNVHLLSDYNNFENYFSPKKLKKEKYRTINASYSFIDSNGVTSTKPLALFTLNRRGYVEEFKEYYLGIANHTIKFDRRFKKRIESTTMTYPDEAGEGMVNFGIFTQYTYSKNSIKTKERPINGKFLDDSEQSYQTVSYDKNGLRIAQFTQYHFENGTREPYHSEIRSEITFLNDTSALRNSYIEDTLWIQEKIILTDFGKEKISETNYSTNEQEVIYRVEREYNSDRQCIHQRIRTPNEGIYTECEDRGEFDLFYVYEKGLLKTVEYTFADQCYLITFSYQ